MENKLDIEYQYQEYLRLMKLKEEDMHPIQRTETKRAFYGACGRMLYLFRDEIGDIEDEDEAIKAMKKLWNQVDTYWNTEVI